MDYAIQLAPKYLGRQPGIIAALHTWSQPLGLPPPVPYLGTGGGLPPAGQWVPCLPQSTAPGTTIAPSYVGPAGPVTG